MVKVEDLSKRRGEFTLEKISFELKEGYIMGLIGPNGSGKTTLIKLLLGLIKPDEGEIKIIKYKSYIIFNIDFIFKNILIKNLNFTFISL